MSRHIHIHLTRDSEEDNPYAYSENTVFKLQIVHRGGKWVTLPDTQFGSKLAAKQYGDKYFARRYRIVEVPR